MALKFSAGEIEKNLAAVRARIAEACGAAGREASSVTLLAASKTQPPEAIRAPVES